MYCLICEPLVKLQLEKSTERWDWFYNYYVCPQCGTKYECSSQSGDMIQENLSICN